MPSDDKISGRQLGAAVFVSLLSPAVRIQPQMSAAIAGSGAWLAPLAAIVPAVLYGCFLTRFVSRRRPGEGMAELILRILGKGPGRAVLLLFSLWFMLYGGLELRTAAERLLASVYLRGEAGVFIVVTLAAAYIAASGRLKSLLSAAELLSPLLGGILVLVLLFSLSDVEPEKLLPLRVRDAPSVLLAAAPLVNLTGAAAWFMFLTDRLEGGIPGLSRSLICLLVFLSAMTLCTVGSLSASLSAELTNPFFSMVRNISLFHVIERIEAVVVALWVLTDFVFLASMIKIAAAVNRKLIRGPERPLIPALGMLAASFAIAPDPVKLAVVSERFVPLLNLLLAFGLLPLIYFIGLVSGRAGAQNGGPNGG
ncbi:MAG: GerAB/ArcD/ProY family transporter [Oscillospiraceae bacterium]|nr:GerAB/ArcD/ProY family transporter [Oscillospiraceae bacterium]